LGGFERISKGPASGQHTSRDARHVLEEIAAIRHHVLPA
jgi:hypothetical protein